MVYRSIHTFAGCWFLTMVTLGLVRLTAAQTASSQPSKDPIIQASVESTHGSEATVRVNWSFPPSDIGGYELECKLISPDEEGHVGNFHLVYLAPGGTSGKFDVAGLLSGRTYEFRIRSDNNDGGVSEYATTSVMVPSDK